MTNLLGFEYIPEKNCYSNWIFYLFFILSRQLTGKQDKQTITSKKGTFANEGRSQVNRLTEKSR